MTDQATEIATKLIDDPSGIFERMEVPASSGGEQIYAVNLRPGDMISADMAMEKFNILKVEMRYWLRQKFLTALNGSPGRNGMYCIRFYTSDNMSLYHCSRSEIAAKLNSLPRLISYEDTIKALKKYASKETDPHDLLYAYRIKGRCNPVGANGELLHTDSPIDGGVYFFRNEIAEIVKSHFSDAAPYTDEEIEAYALKITASKDYRLSEEKIAELLQIRFLRCGLTKDSKRRFDPIMKKIKQINSQYENRGRKPTLPHDKWEVLVADAKREAAIFQPLPVVE